MNIQSIETTIDKLLEMAIDSHEPIAALQYTQAAVNAANALVAVTSAKNATKSKEETK